MIAAMVAGLMVTSAGQPVDAPTFEQRLERLDVRLAETNDVRAAFEQSKRSAMLKKPMVSKGTILARGHSVLWKTVEPRAMAMLVAEKEVRIHYPADRMLEVYPLDDRFRQSAIGPIPRAAALKEKFIVAALDTSAMTDAKETGHLLAMELTPREESLRRHVASVRVLIDERVPCAVRVVVKDPDGDETDIRFSAVERNTGLTEADLELTVPEGTRVSTPVGPKAPAR
jgi:outer membrane lipoprotein-sorting protein